MGDIQRRSDTAERVCIWARGLWQPQVPSPAPLSPLTAPVAFIMPYSRPLGSSDGAELGSQKETGPGL